MSTKKFIDLLNDFDEACKNMSWKGSKPPEDWPYIIDDYNESKQAVIQAYENKGEDDDKSM